ncbi:hypothetical protein NE237_020335 [Protea cynaroides]|uniref:Uncharacterized protein n=1 Tax=Protea cynaroides TaxID=273540 RepID=A0A9Q0K3C2_9MAGN|nr:hypothetical protein NE237_020335 [Protea cynaroides]
MQKQAQCFSLAFPVNLILSFQKHPQWRCFSSLNQPLLNHHGHCEPPMTCSNGLNALSGVGYLKEGGWSSLIFLFITGSSLSLRVGILFNADAICWMTAKWEYQ